MPGSPPAQTTEDTTTKVNRIKPNPQRRRREHRDRDGRLTVQLLHVLSDTEKDALFQHRKRLKKKTNFVI